MNAIPPIRQMVFAALMAALTAAGAFIAIPIGPVPMVLQNFFVMLTGLLLGSRWGTAGIAVYLLAGAIGLPVFAGGTGGIARFAGPTGGFLIGYLPAVFLVGFLSERGKGRWLADVLAMVAGTAVLYGCGVFWLKTVAGLTAVKAMSVGMLPFLAGDALKIAAAALTVRTLRPIVGSECAAERRAVA
ncbi:MAG: biotin transporter BioY [Desulfobacterales bacterium]